MPVHDAAARGFERGADDYEKARPGYPDEVLGLLQAEMPIRPRTKVCDLAAGTGKFTRGLLTTGADVVAVEPVAAMRRQLTVTCPDAQVLDGTAESIPLEDHSVDVVTVAQAFHWFDIPVALAEIHRVLRDGGGLAMVWNRRDEDEPWVAEMSAVIGWHGRSATAYASADWPALVSGAGGFTPLRHEEFRWEQPMTRDNLRGAGPLDQLHLDHGQGRARPVGRRGGRSRRRSVRAVHPPLRRARALVPQGVVPAARPAALLDWFAEHRRDLPWRTTRDPWAVLVSEMMLQQTQMVRVVPRYERFLVRFPSPAACARATAGDVVSMWEGLGYNRRALALHRCAVAVLAEHQGRVPDDLDALLALPGIGPYTARAVLAFAFERDVGVLDTNAARGAGPVSRPATRPGRGAEGG